MSGVEVLDAAVITKITPASLSAISQIWLQELSKHDHLFSG